MFISNGRGFFRLRRPLSPRLFEACCQALLRLLRLRQAGHPILIFEELFNNRPGWRVVGQGGE